MADTGVLAAGDENADLKRRLAHRLAVAGVLAAVLLATLAVFDRLTEEEPAKQVAVSAKRPAAGLPDSDTRPPAASVPDSAQQPSPVEAMPKQSTEAAIAEAATPATISAPKPEAQTVRVLAERQLEPEAKTVPAPAGTAGIAAAVQEQVPEESGVPSEPPPPPRVAAVPTEAVPEESGGPVRRAPPLAREPSPTRLAHGYIVQAGVFSSTRHAEVLHERLLRNGIPARLETRVQVGPFQSREEAEAAREQLRKLGVESLLVPPKPLGRP